MRGIGFALLCLAALPSAARADWHRASSSHFVVYSNDRPERVRELAETLERFDSAVRRLRAFPDTPVSPSNRVTVYTLRDDAAVGRLAGDSFAAGFYMPRASGAVAFVPRQSGSSRFELSALAVLLHEYTHHLMLTTFAHAAFPAWLIEGYAEFHATAVFNEDGSVMLGAPPLHRARGLFSGNWLPVRDMLLSSRPLRDPNRMEALYGRGWLLTHMLTFTGTRDGQLNRFLALMNDGKPAQESAAAFGDLDQLQRDLNAYLRQRRITAATIAAANISVGPVEVRALDPGEAAMMDVRIRSTRGVDERSARAVLNDARRAAAPYPDHGFAQRVLAEAEYDAGNFAEAANAADRAIAADPRLVDAHVYRGMAALAVLRARDGDVTPAEWAAARGWFTRANRIENDAAMPLILFHDSFPAAGEEPTANARAALARAQELAPQDMGLRLRTAVMHLRQHEAERARELLRPIAYAPHAGGLARHAGALIAAIDSGGADAAIAVADRPPGEEDDETASED